MEFHNREKELSELQKLFSQSNESARMTVLTGRRRIGKTLLSIEFSKKHKFIYLFVSKKSESLLCIEYLEEIKKIFDIPVIGEIRTIKAIFTLLVEISRKEHFILIVDEFQEFYKINSSIYSDIQKLWDLSKNSCKLNLILIGSVYSLMHKIFQNSKEPLFGRADRILILKPFRIKIIKNILYDQGINDLKTIFDYYVFTGGIPKYIDLLVTNSAFNYHKILDFILDENSPFINEGKNLLIEEFGKNYGIYFSILELLSVGKTARSEIESILGRNTGGFLERLEKDYNIISKYKPIIAKPASRLQKYKIIDNFLSFWFRFIYRNHSAIEMGNSNYVKQVIERDYSTFCVKALEKFFRELFADTQKYNRIGTYWEKGNQNEIDLVAINDLNKEIVIAEVKTNKERINIEALKYKSQRLLAAFSEYEAEWLGLSLEDAEDYLS